MKKILDKFNKISQNIQIYKLKFIRKMEINYMPEKPYTQNKKYKILSNFSKIQMVLTPCK